MLTSEQIAAKQEEESKRYREIYDQDFDVTDKPHGWIQWKGTDACIDLYCACGERAHFDGEFFYHFRCACGASYALGQNVLLIPLTPEQVERIETEHAPMTPFQTGTSSDDE